MKKLIYSFISLALMALTFNSCVKDKDYDTPQIKCEEPQLDPSEVSSIENALNAWQAENPTSYDRNVVELAPADGTPVYIPGYVVSSDKTGNFYKELYIQDDATDPSHAVKIAIDMRSMFAKYDFGRKIYLKVNGLGINKSHGEMVIGEISGGDVTAIRENLAKKSIKRACEPSVITAKVIPSIADITSDMIGMFIQLDQMQFHYTLQGKPFTDPNDSYDSDRKMLSCADGGEILLETSTFAAFKDNILPEAQGSVKGILSRDYGDDNFVIRVLDPVEAFDFNGNRCDPAMLDCHGTNIGGSNILFNEDFESYSSGDTNIPGWTNVNVNSGTTLFKVGNYSGNNYVKCSAYHSNENPLEVWLVTPPINLDNSTGEELTFRTETGYNNGAALSVYVSTDFTGDVHTATWLLVNTTLANGPSSGYGSWVDGSADISCLSGNVYVAFKYYGGDGGVTTTFEIDDVKVSAN